MARLSVLRSIAGVLIATASVACAVVRLDDSTFDQYVENLSPDALLLVDFYQPNCGHCLKLNPVLDFLEAEWEREEPDPSRRWFKLAKVDASKNSRLRTVFGIKGVPDLRFVRAGQWSTYEGGRLLEDIMEFKERMALHPLRAVDAKELLEILDVEEPVFVLATEVNADSDSVASGVVLTATLMQHSATFATASREVLSSLGLRSETLPALLKVVSGPGGRDTALQTTSFDGDAATASSWVVSRWVEQENYPLLSEFTPDNFSRLGSLGKLMVIGVVNPNEDATPAFTHRLRQVASQLGLNHQDKLVFGTMNGKKYRGFVESLHVFEDLPRLVVLDMPEDVFYAVDNLRLESGEIEAFLIDVLSGGIPGRHSSDGSARYLMKIWSMVENGGAWSLLLLIPVLGCLWVFCDSPEREERREAARQARVKGKEEAARLKSD